MNNEKNILQILDQSACLRKSQLLGYLNHSLYPEELRAVELHLSSCALCSDALEGMEMVQNAEQLINSIQLPVLPAVVIPEKTPEKEPIVKVAEPAPSHPKGRHAKASLPKEQPVIEQKNIQPNKINILKPLGIAAALLIGGGAIWYYQKEKKDEQPNIALVTAADTLTPQPAAAPAMANAQKVDSAALLSAQKKRDSVYLAVKKAERLKARKDSLQLLAQNKAGDTAPGNVAADKAPSMVAAMAKESPAVASNDDAKPMARQAMKEEKAAAKPSKEEADAPASDFEMGMQKYRENNFASALLYFKTAESDNKNPKHWDAVYYAGMCNKSLNKKRKAIKYFQQIVDAKAPQAKAAQKQLDNLKGDD